MEKEFAIKLRDLLSSYHQSQGIASQENAIAIIAYVEVLINLELSKKYYPKSDRKI